MLLGIDNFEQFKVFFDVVYDITDLIELQLFPDHMICSILDKAHTRFMSAEYKKEFFSVYEINDAESVTLFAEDIHTIIKSVNKIDNVILETNDDHLICRLESNNGNNRIFEFVLPAEYIESPQPPSIDIPVTVKVRLDNLKQGIKDLKIIKSGEVKFTINDDTLNITSGIEVNSNYILNIPIESTGETLSSKFSLEYIEQLIEFNKINKNIVLNIGDDYPLLYSIEDDIMGVKINGLIAPRISED